MLTAPRHGGRFPPDTHQVFITDWADAKQVPLA